MDVYDSSNRHFASILSRLAAGALAVVLLAAVPACAQESGESGDEAAPAQQDQASQMQEMQALQQEIQQIQQQLQQIQQQALQDSALQQLQVDLQETIGAAMRQADPQTADREARLNELRSELQTAQQAQDTAQQRELIAEARQLSQQLQQTQGQVMQRDSISQMVEAFRDSLVEVMEGIDAGTEQLMARQDSLMTELRESSSQLQGQQPGAAPQDTGSGGDGN